LCLFLKTGLITNYHFTHHCITTIFLIALDPFPGPCTSIFVSFFLLDLIEISMSTAKSPFSQLFGFCRSPLQQSKTLTFQAAPVDSHLCFLQEKFPHFCKNFSPGTGGEILCQPQQL
jgi:hypothetical protein